MPTSPNELRSALRLPGVPPACAGALPPPELESLAFRGYTAGPCRLRRMNCTVAPRPGVPPAAAGALPLPRCPPGYTASHADSPVELRSTTGPPGVPPAFAGALRPSAVPPRLHRRPAPTRREGSKSVLVLHSLSAVSRILAAVVQRSDADTRRTDKARKTLVIPTTSSGKTRIFARAARRAPAHTQLEGNSIYCQHSAIAASRAPPSPEPSVNTAACLRARPSRLPPAL